MILISQSWHSVVKCCCPQRQQNCIFDYCPWQQMSYKAEYVSWLSRFAALQAMVFPSGNASLILFSLGLFCHQYRFNLICLLGALLNG